MDTAPEKEKDSIEDLMSYGVITGMMLAYKDAQVLMESIGTDDAMKEAFIAELERKYQDAKEQYRDLMKIKR